MSRDFLTVNKGKLSLWHVLTRLQNFSQRNLENFVALYRGNKKEILRIRYPEHDFVYHFVFFEKFFSMKIQIAKMVLKSTNSAKENI